MLYQVVRDHFETFRAEAVHWLRRAGVPALRRLRLIALLDESVVTQRILRHRGLPTDVPPAQPARPPPLGDDAV